VAFDYDPDKDDNAAAFIWYLAPGRKRITSVKKAYPQTQP